MNTVMAKCGHCDREEEFEDQWAAQAWLTGHALEEHTDQFPPLTNKETNQ